MRLGILAGKDNLLSFLCAFLILPGTTFTEYGKILFLQDFELFLKDFDWKDDC